MERLTYFKDGYWRVNFSGVQYQADFVDRLAAYEDIAELCGGFDRLRELAEADKDGRLVVLPPENYDWKIRGDIALGIITENCRRAEVERAMEGAT